MRLHPWAKADCLGELLLLNSPWEPTTNGGRLPAGRCKTPLSFRPSALKLMSFVLNFVSVAIAAFLFLCV
jgi:hypothetical protein